MKLYNTAKRLILEIAAKDSVIKAIKNRDVVVISYDGDEPGGRGLRTIEPVCLGVKRLSPCCSIKLRTWRIACWSSLAATPPRASIHWLSWLKQAASTFWVGQSSTSA